jgi:hypothetical protein
MPALSDRILERDLSFECKRGALCGNGVVRRRLDKFALEIRVAHMRRWCSLGE